MYRNEVKSCWMTIFNKIQILYWHTYNAIHGYGPMAMIIHDNIRIITMITKWMNLCPKSKLWTVN